LVVIPVKFEVAAIERLIALVISILLVESGSAFAALPVVGGGISPTITAAQRVRAPMTSQTSPLIFRRFEFPIIVGHRGIPFVLGEYFENQPDTATPKYKTDALGDLKLILLRNKKIVKYSNQCTDYHEEQDSEHFAPLVSVVIPSLPASGCESGQEEHRLLSVAQAS
jgi:hypothetical protein